MQDFPSVNVAKSVLTDFTLM